MADVKPEEIKSEVKEPEVKTEETKTEQKETVNIEETKKQGVSELLKTLGIENEDVLKSIITKHNEEEESKKTELQKSQDSNKTLTKNLVSEKERADIAEAKLNALMLGARKELVDDLVVIAMAKVTDDKKISEIISEIKESDKGSVYFETKEEQEEKPKRKTVTRTKSKVQEKKTEQNEEPKTLAERLFSTRQKPKNHYFKER